MKEFGCFSCSVLLYVVGLLKLFGLVDGNTRIFHVFEVQIGMNEFNLQRSFSCCVSGAKTW